MPLTGRLLCPSCQEILVPVDRDGVEIDYCPHCRGVWLERGELEKIIERAARPSRAYTPLREPIPYDDDEDYKYRRKRKKKSYLEDLFDIFD
ncbi:MAG: zf-TFIIB domain-containing protein [Armatimonadota bacterium]|nr:zf-TFIIB domain-containing protein [bacterium]MCS7310119.1 zf-TFIIB domain-containing protein [Armatimonadota bacterium]MDW8105763.1 zf-TFIIB domain-containing protein [Armatimonadota bacterium]MDW8290697.1 zf-TFIIB domain-containing protein [Armatimonadota bacterium]